MHELTAKSTYYDRPSRHKTSSMLFIIALNGYRFDLHNHDASLFSYLFLQKIDMAYKACNEYFIIYIMGLVDESRLGLV